MALTGPCSLRARMGWGTPLGEAATGRGRVPLMQGAFLESKAPWGPPTKEEGTEGLIRRAQSRNAPGRTESMSWCLSKGVGQLPLKFGGFFGMPFLRRDKLEVQGMQNGEEGPSICPIRWMSGGLLHTPRMLVVFRWLVLLSVDFCCCRRRFKRIRCKGGYIQASVVLCSEVLVQSLFQWLDLAAARILPLKGLFRNKLSLPDTSCIAL
ncbi:hypothetical protein L7F22_028696 [Adiantum nelumboides]|nr:hypothetical protein [Adiantum nelumboides]